jgi:plasmid stabilization system protein ParE
VKYVLRPGARRDILRQYEYYLIDKDAEQAAERFVVAIDAAIAQICRQPGLGAPKKLASAKLGGLRSWPVPGFAEIRVYYLFSSGVVRVVRVLHSKRDINPLLEAG